MNLQKKLQPTSPSQKNLAFPSYFTLPCWAIILDNSLNINGKTMDGWDILEQWSILQLSSWHTTEAHRTAWTICSIFDPVGLNRVKITKDKIEELIADISQWLLTHMLMFNGGKTEELPIHSKYMHLEPFSTTEDM